MLKKRGHLFSAIILFPFFAAATSPAAAQEPENARERDYGITVPEGTVLPIVMTAYLNTKNSQAGDIVYAMTNYPIWIQQRLAIPKGSEIRGTLTEVVRPGRIKGKGRLVIRFDDILLPNGVKRDLVATFRGIHGPGDEKLNRESESVSTGSSKGEDAGTIASTAATGLSIGTIVGAVSDHTGTGMAIGTAAGAAAGAVQVLLTRGNDLVIEPGTQFDLELLKPLEFSYYEIRFTDGELDDARTTVQDANRNPRYDAPDRGGRRVWPIPRVGLPFPF
ncbi:MAG: hypothetical protein JW793_05585 [Acidobacteria bacterium]|nr:hypothetical protein [Acidobacteriota bacterium]